MAGGRAGVAPQDAPQERAHNTDPGRPTGQGVLLGFGRGTPQTDFPQTAGAYSLTAGISRTPRSDESGQPKLDLIFT